MNVFIKNIHGKEAITALAATIGLVAGECFHGGHISHPGFIGNTFGVKDQLKAAGARWDGVCKAWTFESWAVLETALNNIVGA